MTIFPGLVPDVEPVIISNCDTNALIQLSGVNKQLREIFSNKDFFKNLFETQHKALFENVEIFKVLRSFHPSNCWKVMSQLMNSNRAKLDFPRRLTVSFIEEAVPHFLFQAQSVKQQLTEQMKAICGVYREDPSSPIVKAKKAYEKCREDLHALEEKRVQALNQIHAQLLPVHPDDAPEIVASITKNLGQFQNISEEEFLNIPEEEQQKMLIEHLPLYRSVAEALLTVHDRAWEISNLKFEMTILSRKYQDLEAEKYYLDRDLATNDSEISTFLEDPAGKHREVLAQEFYNARALEDRLTDYPLLNECAELLDQLIDDPTQHTPENLNRIRSLINACGYDVKKYIWGRLYFHCANSIIEDEWSEKHFQDHLLTLKSLVNNQCG
jgi:hypothetical protein